MAPSEYNILREQDLDTEKEYPSSYIEQPRHVSRAAYWLAVLSFILFCFNTVWAYQQYSTRYTDLTAPTLYAGLVRNLSVPFTNHSIYTSSNRTIEDEAWSSPSLNPFTGSVALSDDWVRSKNLPEAQRFPWDKSKGIYVLNGYHNIHCLHSIREAVLEAYDGNNLTWRREHIAHCLNILREVILCDADDTPRYTGRLNQQASTERPHSGIGQIKMCRDWSQLETWAVEHSACYKGINFSNPAFPPIERYKFCPNGEKLWP